MDIEKQKDEALSQLKNLEINKITLARDIFFIPGWSSENCGAWLEPYTDNNTSMKEWLERTTTNWQGKAHFVTFTEEESKKSRSFIDFGKALLQKISPYIGASETKIDLIGHSMGGLDISSSIIYNVIPLEKVKNVMTLGSPFHGSEWGRLMKDIEKFSWLFLGGWMAIRAMLMAKGYSYYHILQLENMNPKGRLIKEFNSKENRIKLLNSVSKLYTFFGTDDDTVKESALFNGFGIAQNILQQKLEAVCVEGATHSGASGLPQDPRVVLGILKIVSA